MTDAHDSEETEFLAAATRFLESQRSLRPADDHADHSMFVTDEGDELDFIARAKQWQRVKFDHGWAGISWPTDVGGRGGSALQDSLFREVEQRYISPWLTHNLGIEQIGPTIAVHGTEAQKDRYVRPMLRGETVWTVCLSEPEAGSDMAASRTRAVRDDNGWVVNGQKVWSSRAHLADHAILLARTNTDVPKHQGLSCFIIDLKSPGITVRPIKQMNGAAHFNEVFFTDYRLPLDALLGEVDHGWSVMMTQLQVERNILGVVKTHIPFTDLLQLATQTGRTSDAVVRQRLATAYGREAILRLMGSRIRAATLRGSDPGAVAAVMKLAYAQNSTQAAELALDLLGPEGMLSNGGGTERWSMEFLGAPATRIGGGTDEIQRNIIAERVLGLPREPRAESAPRADRPGRGS